MNEKKCNKCGGLYDTVICGNRCPNWGWRDEDSSDYSELPTARLYGPRPVNDYEINKNPPTDLYATLYGPLPSNFSDQKTWRKHFNPIILFTIGALFGGILVWLYYTYL